MTLFLFALAVLVVGYFIYGTLAAKVFGIDPARKTPVALNPDGVDFVPMSTWKVFLIQFLNIAGLGPIFGAIMGAMFGPAAFIWIAFGTIFAGGVHDFISAMISLRHGGQSLPEMVGNELGSKVKAVMNVFCIGLLLLVTAVFVVSPAGLLAGMFDGESALNSVTLWIIMIFCYYVLATLLPIDKIIGRAYPVFGFALLFMAAGIMAVLIFGDVTIPTDASSGFFNRRPDSDDMPLFPMMFVTIACGAISGFHATQSPMMARCLKNEKLAQPVFYGAMVAEGIVALVWAAAAIAFTGGFDGLNEYLSANSSGALVKDISISWLGAIGGVLAIVGVIVAPITSGDTALRSARLITAEIFNIRQGPIKSRLMVCLPLVIITGVVTLFASDPQKFQVVWRYFAWFNQTLSVFTLWACTYYLRRKDRAYVITLIPAMFMTAVSVSFLLVAPASQGGLSLLTGPYIPLGIGLGVLSAFIPAIAFFAKKRVALPSAD